MLLLLLLLLLLISAQGAASSMGSRLNQLVGITGTNGAGKGAIVEYLTERHGFRHFSVRGYLTEKLASQNLEATRENLITLANKLRAENSPSYIIEQLLEQAVAESNNGQGCIIESVRTLGEVQALKAAGQFTLLAVDADQRVRYDRVVKRKSATDMISFETFVEQESREMDNGDDPTKQNLSGCIRAADHVLKNDRDLAALYAELDKILSLQTNSN